MEYCGRQACRPQYEELPQMHLEQIFCRGESVILWGAGKPAPHRTVGPFYLIMK